MTMNKTWLAAIAIALASSTQVQAWGHWDLDPGPFPFCAEIDYSCRDLSEHVGERTIDEARRLVEEMVDSYFVEAVNDANACIAISSTIGVVMICPPPPEPDPCPIEPHCMGIWEIHFGGGMEW